MDTLPLTTLAKSIADRVADENAARDKMMEFMESLYAAVEGVVPEMQAAGLEIGVIAVLHQGSLDAGPDAFYRYYTEELGLTSFQVNTPFPGGPAKAVEADLIEIVLPSGASVRVDAQVDVRALRRVLGALSGR